MRELRLRATWLGVLVGALLGAPSPVMAQSPAGALLRGFVAEETLPGLYSFRPCAGARTGTRAFLINDNSPKRDLFAAIVEIRKSRSEPEQPLYVEFRGALTDKHANAAALERVVGFVTQCNEIAPIAPAEVLWVDGRDPAWSLRAGAAGARLEVLGERAVRFPSAPFRNPQRLNGVSVIDAWSRDDGGSVRVEVRQELCVDAAAEAAYGSRVTVRFGSRELTACAVNR